MTPGPIDWASVKDKKWEAGCMEVYAAMIDRMDQNIGKLITELKRNGQFDDTLILFLQDNGGCAEPQGRTGNKNHPNIDRPEKPTLLPQIAAVIEVSPAPPPHHVLVRGNYGNPGREAQPGVLGPFESKVQPDAIMIDGHCAY